MVEQQKLFRMIAVTSAVVVVAGGLLSVGIVSAGPPAGAPTVTLKAGVMPTIATAASDLQRSVKLTWNSVAGATGYKVYRNTSSGTEAFLATVGAVTSYTDTSSLAEATTYFYQVSATNVDGEGPLSTEVSGNPSAIAFQVAASTTAQTSSNEMSIGSNWVSGNAMLNDRFHPTKVLFNDAVFPPLITFSAITSGLGRGPTGAGADPILWTDSGTGRTFVGEELGPCSQMYTTDNDGLAWAVDGNACAGADHETITSGPLATASPLHALGSWPSAANPRAVYYCAQSIADASCSVSLDGGVTFLAPVQIYQVAGLAGSPIPNTQVCGGLHGKARVAANDGAVYLPNKACGGGAGAQGVVVSTDGGLTWTTHPVAGNAPGRFDPGVAIGAHGQVYLAMNAGGTTPKVAVSTNHGASWTTTALPAPAGFSYSRAEMMSAIAGDNDRAAVAFLATDTAPAATCTNTDPAKWHLFVSMTYDNGTTWTTTDVTGADPVQIGMLGDAAPCRNLLDFFDMTVDREGRVLVGFQDGCTTRLGVADGAATAACLGAGGVVNTNTKAVNSRDSWATIALQTGGKGLLSVYDPS